MGACRTFRADKAYPADGDGSWQDRQADGHYLSSLVVRGQEDVLPVREQSGAGRHIVDRREGRVEVRENWGRVRGAVFLV